MTDASSKLRLNRKQLSELFGNNPVAIRAFENIFDLVVVFENGDLTAAELAADAALAQATAALETVVALLKQQGGEPTGNYVTKGELDTALNNVYVPPVADSQPALGVSRINLFARGINLNALGDTLILVTLPVGNTRFQVINATLSNPSISPIATAFVGLYTAAARGGVTIGAQQALAISSAAANINGNLQTLTLSNGGSTAYSVSTLYLNVGTVQGAAATVDLTITIGPVP